MDKLIRDKNSKALLNTDTKGFEEYKQRRAIILKQKQELEDRFKKLEDEIENLKGIIKNILKEKE